MFLEVCLPSRLTLSVALTAVLFPAALWSQTDEVHVIPRDVHPPKSEGNADPALQNTKPLRTDVSLVLVPVTVRDAMNRPIVDLKTDNFKLFEENQQQDLRHCWKEDAPISVGVILDFSKSMSNKIEMETAAVREFFNNANSQDDYFVVAISDRPHLIADSSDSFDELQRRMATTVPDGNTALLDGIYVGLKKMRTARYSRRALLIISDGGDNHSYYNTKKIKRMAQEADVMIYAIGIFDNMPVPVFKTIEEKLGQHLLTEITELTGGFTIAADNREKLPEIAGTISRTLREQYVLAYRPKNQPHDGKWKKIKVQVMGLERLLPLHVDYKKGYISPG
jgi:Ca-activated chloride channel homolog